MQDLLLAVMSSFDVVVHVYHADADVLRKAPPSVFKAVLFSLKKK